MLAQFQDEKSVAYPQCPLTFLKSSPKFSATKQFSAAFPLWKTEKRRQALPSEIKTFIMSQNRPTSYQNKWACEIDTGPQQERQMVRFQAEGCQPASAHSSPLTAALAIRKQMASAISSARMRRFNWVWGKMFLAM